MMSTRLLVLGAVKILQPVHGYDVRRELMSWQLDAWMNLQAGSIYSALKTLERDGNITVTSRQRAAGRPERTEFVLTAEGDKEFSHLLRTAWWTVDAGTTPIIPALTLLPFMEREELIAALQSRVRQLTGQVQELKFVRATVRDGATGADGDIPEHVREVIDYAAARLKGELDWSRGFIRRLRAGAYELAGDDTATS
ncbi:MAG: helix-turn-helix transcriptional regulator [Ilumatobacteraceae bacterium]